MTGSALLGVADLLARTKAATFANADVNLYTDERGQRGVFVALYAKDWPSGQLTGHALIRDSISALPELHDAAVELLAQRDRALAALREIVPLFNEGSQIKAATIARAALAELEES